MSVPIAPDSRKPNPEAFAVIPHPRNLAKKATTQMRMTYPHVFPLSRRPKLVFNPDKVKYYK